MPAMYVLPLVAILLLSGLIFTYSPEMSLTSQNHTQQLYPEISEITLHNQTYITHSETRYAYAQTAHSGASHDSAALILGGAPDGNAVALTTNSATNDMQARTGAKELSIASWNLFDFGGKFGGTKKIDDPVTLNAMTDVIKQYDVIFVQEIANMTKAGRDIANPFTGFNNLCEMLDPLGYLCKDTGVINDHEGYGVIYKDDLVNEIVVERTDHDTVTPHIPLGRADDEMRRPPMKATMDLGVTDIVVYSSHTQPTSAPKEISLMSNAISAAHSSDMVIVLGDLNADGKRKVDGRLDSGSDYYRGGFQAHPDDFPASHWMQTVTDDDVTNFAKSQRSYDRIILSKSLVHSYDDYGIVGSINSKQFDEIRVANTEKGKALSDHRLVWVNLKFGSIMSADVNGDIMTEFSDYMNSDNCTSAGSVYAGGEGFVSDRTIHLYVTEYPGNNMNSNFKSDNRYDLVDVTGGYESVTTDMSGTIENTQLWAMPEPGNYNVIADVDADGYFTYGIDIADVVNGRGLVVSECTIATPPDTSKDPVTLDINVYNDANGNAARNLGETPLQGLLVLTYVPSTGEAGIVFTDSGGSATKDDLPPAEFYAIALPQPEYTATTNQFDLLGTTYYGVLHVEDPQAGSTHVMEIGITPIQ